MSELKVRQLGKTFVLRSGFRTTALEAVRDVSFDLTPGRTVALVGQSGSGKSTVARMIARLERPTTGEITLDGRTFSQRGREAIAYRDQVQMVFQDPFASLNPFHTIEHHLTRPLLLHGKARSAREAREGARVLLERVNLEPGADFLHRRPHELSGGQRQRVAIARALAPEPSVLIADEPVSMLDVSIRLGVLNLLARLQREDHLAVLYITHDLATARHFSDEILVMLKGEVVERGPADDVILNPQADFTKQLREAAPEPSRNVRFAGLSGKGEPLSTHLRRPLDHDWQVRPVAGPVPDQLREPIPAAVPGIAHTDLLAAGSIPDPFVGQNEAALAWVGECDFCWSTDVERPDGDHERIDLLVGGIDTVADLRLNDQLVGRVRNQHRSYRIDIGEALRPGVNALEVEIRSGLVAAREAEGRLGALPHVGNPLPYNAVRKAAYSFGWDWGPVLVTSGIWKPIVLHAWSIARLDRVLPQVRLESDEEGRVIVDVDVERTANPAAVTVRARVAGVSTEIELAPGWTSARLELSVPDPEIWWPRGYGEQPLYDLEVDMIAGAEVIDSWHRRIGFRRVELRNAPDAHGVSFEIMINGVPVWVKGANWIPDDSFLPRVDDQRYAAGVRDAVDAGFNLIRVWGGGIYEDDALYAACDAAGVLVWQDFAFACAAYSEAPELWTEIEAEATEHIVRLAPHPSLIVWNGSNENIEGFYHWGWREQLGDDVPWGRGYYDQLLPKLLAELDPTRPYIPSSPFSPGEASRPRTPEDGSVHSWEVWNRRDYTHYADVVPRFVAEFGYQGPAQWSTLAAVLDDLAPDSPDMLAHQKADDGLGKIERGMAPHLPAPVDTDAWHFAAQLNQARAVEFGVAHWRGHWPQTTGSIVWQLNDCWPVTSWAIVDSGRRRKPVWYAMRRLNAPRWAALRMQGGELELVLHNDTDEVWTTDVDLRRLTFDGTVQASDRREMVVGARQSLASTVVPEVATPAHPGGELIIAEVSGAERAWHWFAEDPQLDLPELQLDAEPSRTPEGWSVELTARGLVKDLILAADRLASDAVVSEQVITLLPGEQISLEVRTGSVIDPQALVTYPVLQSVNTLAHPPKSPSRPLQQIGARG